MFLLVDKAILLLVESHVKGVVLGSVSQYIIERAKCPVLVVK